jgi:LysM repeat protein
MARRSPARLLAPLALVGFLIALLVVINGSGSDDGGSGASESRPAATTTAAPARKQKGGGGKGRRTYRVKPGDTPSGIAEKTDVPLSRILELNPDLDDQTLTVGDRIKLRP